MRCSRVENIDVRGYNNLHTSIIQSRIIFILGGYAIRKLPFNLKTFFIKTIYNTIYNLEILSRSTFMGYFYIKRTLRIFYPNVRF